MLEVGPCFFFSKAQLQSNPLCSPVPALSSLLVTKTTLSPAPTSSKVRLRVEHLQQFVCYCLLITLQCFSKLICPPFPSQMALLSSLASFFLSLLLCTVTTFLLVPHFLKYA